MKKKTVVLVIPSLHAGGMERVMAELAGYFLNKPYINLHLVLYGIKREIFYALPSNLMIHKPAFEFDNSQRFISTVKTLFFLRRKLHSLKADAILSFGEYWNSFVLLSILGKKMPVFVSDRCQPDKNMGRIQEFLRKWLYPKAKGIVAQTVTAASIYQKNIGHKNIEVIGNPIRIIKSGLEDKKENTVLTVGRLIETKHHDELIKLFVKINLTGWKLIIVGDDAQKQNNMRRLQQLVTQLNATDKIILAGSRQNVEAYYNSSKIFAFTSSSEGFPNVVGEAQAAGLPVIAFDCISGPSEMIADNENGFLIPLFNYQLFQQKLTQLMLNEKLQLSMGTTAKKSIQKYSIDNIGFAFEKFILEEKQ